MLFSSKNREDSEKLNKLVTLQRQIEAVRLQENVGKQNFQEDMKKVFEPVTVSIENTSRDITKTLSETFIRNNQAFSDLKGKVLELKNNKGMIAPDLASFLVNLIKPENGSQFKLLKDHNSFRKNDILMNTSLPVTLHSNILTFREYNKFFKLDGYLLETITNYDFNVDHSNQQDRKLIYEFGKEMKFDNKQKGRKRDRDESLKRLLKSPAILASGISSKFLRLDPTEVCDRKKLILQKRKAGNNSKLINDKIAAIVDKLL